MDSGGNGAFRFAEGRASFIRRGGTSGKLALHGNVLSDGAWLRERVLQDTEEEGPGLADF
jgi:hypothetical protein